MGKIYFIVCRIFLILWIMTAILAIVWGTMFHDMGAFGLAGLIFIWIFFWEKEKHDNKITRKQHSEK